MVEGALRSALSEEENTKDGNAVDRNTLAGSMANPQSAGGKIKINITQPENTP